MTQMERDILMIFTPQLKGLPGNLSRREQIQPGTQPTEVTVGNLSTPAPRRPSGAQS